MVICGNYEPHYGDENPNFVDKVIAGKANNVVVLAEKSLVIESTPEAIRYKAPLTTTTQGGELGKPALRFAAFRRQPKPISQLGKMHQILTLRVARTDE